MARPIKATIGPAIAPVEFDDDASGVVDVVVVLVVVEVDVLVDVVVFVDVEVDVEVDVVVVKATHAPCVHTAGWLLIVHIVPSLTIAFE